MSETVSGATLQTRAQAWLGRLRAAPGLALIVSAAAAIAIVFVMVMWARSPDYRVLFSNLSDRDGGEIIAMLNQMNVTYQFSPDGGALLVPSDKVHELRLRLAQAGLPKGGAVGFELLDQEKFGISQFSEQVNYQRALEGELARTIETLGPVSNARVHLAIPRPTLFVREQKAPSASVTLTLLSGRALDEGQINAIVHLVSSAVSGLPPGGVTLVDQTGRLLTHGAGGDRDLNNSQLKYTGEVENRIQQRIEAILQPVVGSGNVHARVSAQLDFADKEQTEEQYRPNGDPQQAAVRSRQLNESQQTGSPYPGGIPGALSNQPAPANSAPITAPARNAASTGTANTASQDSQSKQPGSNQRDETTNYELDRTLRHTKLNIGDIQRLSVAVVVNYRATADGKPLPLNADQLKQIEALTREAMGFSAARGDTLNVVNSPFVASDENASALPFWQQQLFIDQMLVLGRWLVVLLVAWLLWRKAVRPQLLRREAVLKAAAQPQQMRQTEEPAVEVRLSKDEQQQQRRNNQRLSAEVMSQRIRDMADSDPRVVALVIRQWMSNEL
ncbi:flagellar basal-body MS-ring/collar protein FliF [Entomohabitans teleogrylli]|uniref:flagellar basal-body MS-ring/collar protein FliF n=1 Tax=Entomohabitans teleogrylli TaxID=1384589 RepID=UPI00073D7043|nr:flagellar basal-body MS-ring/collar protein FliF [Entomohabitans teleogrylli]